MNMLRRFTVGLLLLCFAPSVIAQTPAPTVRPPSVAPDARPPLIPTSAFASYSGIGRARLSPDGKFIAMRIASEGKVLVGIWDIANNRLENRIVMGEDQELEWFRWAGNDRVLISISQLGRLFDEEVRISRVIVKDLKSQSVFILAKKQEGPVGDDVLYVDPAGEYLLLAMQKSIYDWPSVWRYQLDATSEKTAKQVQQPKDGVWDWYADNLGSVRMGIGWTNQQRRIWYRKTATDPLVLIAKLKDDEEDKAWDVIRIISGSDEGYVLEKSGETVALRKFNYATRTSGEIIYQNPQWDVTDFYIDDQSKPYSAFYTDDKERVVWFDPKMKAMQSRLNKAMPDMDIWVTNSARDDSRMLVHVGREDDPGSMYIYTAATRHLDFFTTYRAKIDPTQLTRPKAISYVARDKTLIRGYLTLPRGRDPKGLPLIILPHGGPYGVRDTLTYDDEVQFLSNRGYAVLQPNFRGSGGYGEPFENIGDGQMGRKMQDDLDDGMDWLAKEGTIDPARVCVVGASYGGYAALWAVIRNPERYRCAASFAAITDMKKWLSYSGRRDDKKGKTEWSARVKGEDPAFDLASISPTAHVARLTRPVLLTHGDKDTQVPFSHFKMMRDAAAKAGKSIDTVVFPKEGHGFTTAENEKLWYDSLEAFLTKHNPAEVPAR